MSIIGNRDLRPEIQRTSFPETRFVFLAGVLSQIGTKSSGLLALEFPGFRGGKFRECLLGRTAALFGVFCSRSVRSWFWVCLALTVFLGVVSFAVLLLLLCFPFPLPLPPCVDLVGSVFVTGTCCLPCSNEFWGRLSVFLACIITPCCPFRATGATLGLALFG